MTVRRWLFAVLTGIVAVPAAALRVDAQETTIKGGVSVSRFQTTGLEHWDDRLIATTFGGHARFRFGPVALQPEVLITTRGASASSAPETEQMRLDHIELGAMLVLPLTMGDLEPFAFAGPSLMLESRCRYLVRQDGLRTTVDCDPPAGQLFARTAFDYGLTAGVGVSHRIGDGRLAIEARHTRGLRNIYDGGAEFEARNRSFAAMIGYTLNLGDPGS
ncbi:hypothetical protein BH23GEM9_BH23GEM9_07150 [soil metagenome]